MEVALFIDEDYYSVQNENSRTFKIEWLKSSASSAAKVISGGYIVALKC